MTGVFGYYRRFGIPADNRGRTPPKRQATGSNPAGGAKMTAVSRFLMVYSGFLLLFFRSVLAALPERFYTFSAVCLLIGFELFFRPC